MGATREFNMDTNSSVISYMKKITVTLETGTSPDNMDLSEHPFSLQFIYGIGVEGICLFEKSLFEKQPGDKTFLQVDPCQAGEVFGHLKQQLIDFLPMSAPFYLKTTIRAIEAADNREIVQAMAKGVGANNCGCGCNGDCSC